MNRILTVTILGCALGISLAAAAGASAVEPPRALESARTVYRSLFGPAAEAPAPDDLAGVPEPLRARIERYLARRAALLASRGAGAAAAELRAVLEHSIVALVERHGVERIAAQVAGTILPPGRPHGAPHTAAAEASRAEDLLKADPGSPLAPWFYVFIAQRQRLAFEALERAGDAGGMRAAAKKYRTFVVRARSAGDPIYPAIAEALETLPYLLEPAATHPRDYAPDT